VLELLSEGPAPALSAARPLRASAPGNA
jgi:hypothetical protein